MNRFRDDNVLLIGTGNVGHNLYAPFARPSIDGWAARFEQRVRTLVQPDDAPALVRFAQLGPDAVHAVPTPEDLLPLRYILGTRQPDDTIAFPTAGVIAGAIWMLSVRAG
jgi:4,5-DOPA dioxygenase extradiol